MLRNDYTDMNSGDSSTDIDLGKFDEANETDEIDLGVEAIDEQLTSLNEQDLNGNRPAVNNMGERF